MLGLGIRWGGYLARLRMFLATMPHQIMDEIIPPWKEWVIRWRIPSMFLHKGRVSGVDGQMQWPALSRWTKERKTPGTQTYPLVSTLQLHASPMVRGYRIDHERQGMGRDARYIFTLYNVARANSRWASTVDYPSILHLGAGPWSVVPRPSNKSNRLAWQTSGGKWHVYRSTHPSGIPPRRHIRWFIADIIKLGRAYLDTFGLTKIRHGGLRT